VGPVSNFLNKGCFYSNPPKNMANARFFIHVFSIRFSEKMPILGREDVPLGVPHHSHKNFLLERPHLRVAEH